MKGISNSNKLFFASVFISTILSFISAYYFIFVKNINFAYFDANTRINIARRIFDNLTPGLAQIGNVWPPFPQILMTPFVTFDYLWRSGLAAWFVSGIAYVVAGAFIFKTIEVITKKPYLGLLGALSFLVNINVLYLQSTAMSEVFFLATLSAIMYFFTMYTYKNNHFYLYPAAIAVFLATLTRYEAYALVVGSGVIVFFTQFFSSLGRKKAESTLILFLVPASLGIILWSFYLWIIFGDPLYWLHYYGAVSSGAPTVQKATVFRPSVFDALGTYSTSVIYMCGLITTVFGGLGMFYTIVSKSIKKEFKYLLIFPLMIFIFMALTLMKNTPIEQPALSFSVFFDKSVNLMKEFNIRYGLSLLPFLIVFSIVLVNRIRFSFIPFILLVAFQTAAYFTTPYFLTYQLPLAVGYGIAEHSLFMRDNYDGGLILISAKKHDPEMIQMDLPYKTFIHEGTQYYWNESTKKENPAKYATWIIFDRNIPEDEVTKYLKDSPSLKKYDLVFMKEGVRIYKLTNKNKS